MQKEEQCLLQRTMASATSKSAQQERPLAQFGPLPHYQGCLVPNPSCPFNVPWSSCILAYLLPNLFVKTDLMIL